MQWYVFVYLDILELEQLVFDMLDTHMEDMLYQHNEMINNKLITVESCKYTPPHT